MPLRTYRTWPVLAVMLIALVGGSMRPVAAQDAQPLLERAATVMADLDSFHFLLTTTEGRTEIFESLELERVEGDFARPLGFDTEVEVSAQIASLIVDVVGLDGRVWVRNPLGSLGEEWIEATAETDIPLQEFVNPEWLIQIALDSIQNPVLAGKEEIDGQPTRRIDGTLDLSGIDIEGTPVAFETASEPVDVSIWIDEQDRVVRIEFDGPLLAVEEGSGKLVRRLDLSRFNEDVTIEAPA